MKKSMKSIGEIKRQLEEIPKDHLLPEDRLLYDECVSEVQTFLIAAFDFSQDSSVTSQVLLKVCRNYRHLPPRDFDANLRLEPEFSPDSLSEKVEACIENQKKFLIVSSKLSSLKKNLKVKENQYRRKGWSRQWKTALGIVGVVIGVVLIFVSIPPAGAALSVLGGFSIAGGVISAVGGITLLVSGAIEATENLESTITEVERNVCWMEEMVKELKLPIVDHTNQMKLFRAMYCRSRSKTTYVTYDDVEALWKSHFELRNVLLQVIFGETETTAVYEEVATGMIVGGAVIGTGGIALPLLHHACALTVAAGTL